MVKQKMKLDTPGDVNSMLASMAVGASAPVEKKEEVKKPAPVPAPAKPKRKAPVKSAQKEKSSFMDLIPEKEKKELRDKPVNLRIRKSYKEKFLLICEKLGRSQSDMVEFWIDYTLNQMMQEEAKK